MSAVDSDTNGSADFVCGHSWLADSDRRDPRQREPPQRRPHKPRDRQTEPERSSDAVCGTGDLSRRLRRVRDALASHRRLRVDASGASANNATAPGAGICVNITARPNETWVPTSTT